MSMQLSTFKNLFRVYKAKNQLWMFELFSTAGISPLHVKVKRILPKHSMLIFRLVKRL